MSQQDVENLRAFLERRRGETLHPGDLWIWMDDLSLLDPDVTFEDAGGLPDMVGETYRGHDGIRRSTERYIEPFEWMVHELQQIIDAGECLVSIHRWRAKARHTGIEFDGRMAYLWTFREGKIIHFRGFRSPKRAIEAAGLEA